MTDFGSTTARTLPAWVKASSQPVLFLCVAMIAALWAAVTVILHFERERTIEVAGQQAGNLARLLEENTASMLRGVDRTLLLLRQEYVQDAVGFDLARLARLMISPDVLTIQFAIAGSNGRARALTVADGGSPTANFADREWFQQQRDSVGDTLVISRPTPGRLSNKLAIILSRPIRKADGSFDGVVAASIDPHFIEGFFKSIDVGANGSVLLRSLNGVILASGGMTGPQIGRQVMQPALRDALAKSPNGLYWGGGAVDGINRLVAYRTAKDIPVVVMVGLAEGDIFTGYQRTRMIFVSSAVVVTWLLVLGAFAGIRHHLRLIRSSDAQRLAEKNLEEARTFLDTIIENVPLPIVVKNPKTLAFELVNRAYEAFIGTSRDKIIGKTLYDIYPQADAESVVRSDVEASASEKRIVVAELSLRTPTNGVRIVTTTRLVVRDDKGGPSHLITVIDDVTDRRETDKKIVHMAHHDSLTDLPNRALLQDRLSQGLTRVARGESLAVFCLDLDDFKTVNDTLGHPVGDLLLQAVADRLRVCVRETDTVARFGGDEFAILQIATGDSGDIIALARRIVESIHAPYDLGNHRVNVGISIGIAVAPGDGSDPDLLLKNADLALYRAKAEGRGSYRFFEPEMDTRMRARRALELDIRNALVNGEFEMYYQPLVNLSRDEVCGFEALMRWNHPQRGLVFPGEFIAIAEDMGMIAQIGEWALRQACAEARNWPAHMVVAVNLSPAQFRSENLVQMVFNALATSGLPGHRLELEITESAFLQNIDATCAALYQLRALGIRISMDDFGTGYSSLGYLQSFPFDKIKIDRSFIKNLSDGHGSVSILKAIVSLANSLGMTTIAEGVETADQLAIVRAEGCTELQGFLFSAALRSTDIPQFFSARGERAVSAA